MVKGRLAELDVLRTVAVLLVAGHHWSQFVAKDTSFISRLMWRTGWTGVDLFFVLSGFLVSGLLFREHATYGKVNVVRFLVRRGFRIYPSFYVMIAVMFAVQYGNEAPVSAVWKPLLAELTFFQNYFRGLWNHTWSLAIEEHFYLLLGLAFMIFARKKSLDARLRRVVLPVILVGLACLGARAIWASSYGYNWFRIYAPTHMRIDALLFGVMLSYAYHYKRAAVEQFITRFSLPILVLSLALLVCPVVLPQEAPFMYTFGLLFLTFGFGGIMMLMVVRGGAYGRHVPWLVKPLAFVGQHSYSIYLWHMPVLWFLTYRLLKETGLQHGSADHFWAYLGGTLLIGIGAAKLIEIPALAIRDRVMPSRSGTIGG